MRRPAGRSSATLDDEVMRITSVLLGIGGVIFVLLGLLHALYTFLDTRRPRRLVPDDPAVSAAMARSHLRLTRGRTTMWQAWVGFNFSHSLGVVLFGALSTATGAIIAKMAAPGPDTAIAIRCGSHLRCDWSRVLVPNPQRRRRRRNHLPSVRLADVCDFVV